MIRPWMGIAVLALGLGGCGGGSGGQEPEAKASAAPEVFTASGKLVLLDGTEQPAYGTPCQGSGGYDDIRAGAQILVRDSTGKQVGLGSLKPGESVGAGQCQFKINVPNVPSGDNIYSIEVANRGEISFTADEYRAIDLTIGEPGAGED